VVLVTADFAAWPSNTGAAGVDMVVQVRQTDVAGNPSPWESKTFRYSDDQVFAPSSIQVESGDLQSFPQVLQDGYFNNAEASAGLKFLGTGDAGRYVRVTVSVGEVLTHLPLVQVDEQGNWAVTVDGAALQALGQGAALVSAVQRNGETENADESPVINFNTPFVIDTTEPTIQATVLSVVNAQDQVLAHAAAGDVLLVKVRLSEAVTLAGGTPELDIGLAGPAAYDAVRSADLGPNWLVFAYTVAHGDSALEGTLEVRHAGPPIWVVTPETATREVIAGSLAPASFIPVFSLLPPAP
jgi:hypothetical protein